METMERELGRLQRLIEDLFTLSRAEVGRLELHPEPTDVGAVVRRLVDTIAPLAWGQRRVQVLAEVAPDLPPARADAERLEQVVSNLLGNAVRHTPPGGLVAAAVCTEPEAVRIEVRDTGEGIAPQDLPRVFERFYRGPNIDVERRDGAGLGLALVKELAEAMGGSVEAASVPGEGSCFTVRLPRG
jgi:signal transduction histidine kinase